MQQAVSSSAIRFYPLPNTAGFDVIWDVLPAKSGIVYVSACCEAHEVAGERIAKHARLYAFDPETEEFSLAVDMAELSGEVYTGDNIIDGKIHFSLCEGPDGTIYGGTHMHTIDAMKQSSNRFDWWRQMRDRNKGFVGGKLFAYYPGTGRATVLGVPQPHQGIRVMTMDQRNGRIYGIGFPWSNLWRYDLATGVSRNLGEVPYRNPYGLEVDKKGRVFTLTSRGEMIRYNPVDDMLVTLPVRAPGVKKDDETLCELKTRRSGESLIGSTLLGCRAFEYFPYEGDTGLMRDLGQILPVPEGAVFNVTEALMEGEDGLLYFTVVVGAEKSREARLIRLNPDAKAGENTEDLGRIFANGEPVRGTYRGGTGQDGRVYFAALIPGDTENALLLGQFDPTKLTVPKVG